MRCTLVPHPDFPSAAVSAIEVEIDRSVPGVTTLWYTVFGSLNELIVPPETDSERADELWTATCFEMFVTRTTGQGYLEFNFSPSTQWAAYQFDSYRAGMMPASVPHPPIISHSAIDWLDLHVTLPLDLDDGQRLQLAAIIEQKDGTKSYWALAHPPSGPPDFHHPDCFALTLPAPGGA